jgi:hypothetical protein
MGGQPAPVAEAADVADGGHEGRGDGDVDAGDGHRPLDPGAHDAGLQQPASASRHSHAASATSVMRPGTCLTCRALTNKHSN